MAFFGKIFGDPNRREVGKYQAIVDEVNNFEPELEKLTDQELQQRSVILKEEVVASARHVMADTAPIDDIDAQQETRRNS